jgi:hypothetical protein
MAQSASSSLAFGCPCNETGAALAATDHPQVAFAPHCSPMLDLLRALFRQMRRPGDSSVGQGSRPWPGAGLVARQSPLVTQSGKCCQPTFLPVPEFPRSMQRLGPRATIRPHLGSKLPVRRFGSVAQLKVGSCTPIVSFRPKRDDLSRLAPPWHRSCSGGRADQPRTRGGSAPHLRCTGP